MYNIRLSTKDLKVERALHELIDQVISNKTCIPVVDEVNGNILTETVDFRTIGYVDVSSTSDLVEYIYTYEVLDVWLAPVSQVKTNIPAIKQILFDVNVKKHNEPLVNDTVPVLVIRRGVVASITVNDTFAGSVAKADMIFTNELGEANQATVILNWNNGGLVETFDLLFLPNETKTLSSIVAVTPDLWLGNVDVMLGGDVEASYTFKVRGLATFIQSNCLQCTANDTFIRLHAAVNINESTILNLGTAVFVRDSIYLTQLNCIASGTLYDLRFSDTIGTPYRFPLSEGGNSRFAQCVLTGLVADVSPVWGKQDFVHWNLKYGATKLVDTVIGNIAFIPYSTSKIRMFNDIPVDGTDYAALIWTFVP